MSPELVRAVLDRLGLERPRPDLDGLERLYRAWGEAVPFDNVQKLLHLSEGRSGPLPGSDARSFFSAWLEHRTGGTCWAGNGALHDLLAALGFEVERAAATMMPAPDTPGPNHGSVVVRLDGERWIVDASILSGRPLRIPRPDEPVDPAAPLPRVERMGGTFAVVWRTLRAPGGFPCRFDRIGVGAAEWDALHQRTAACGPFNHALSARVNRGPLSLGWATGVRFELDAAGRLATQPRDRAGRDRFLVEELGVTPDLVARLPDDRPTP